MKGLIWAAKVSNPVLSLNIYFHTGCGVGGRWKSTKSVEQCVYKHPHACACACVCVITSSSVRKCLWETYPLRTAIFLPQQWPHRAGAEADASCLFQSSAFVCVRVCVFVYREEQDLAGASCVPSGAEVCVFPTSLQHRAQLRQHWLLACSYVVC